MLNHINLSATIADVCAVAELHAQHHTSLTEVTDLEWLLGVQAPAEAHIDTLTVLKKVYDLTQVLYFTSQAA